jgi:hypothetical protein
MMISIRIGPIREIPPNVATWGRVQLQNCQPLPQHITLGYGHTDAYTGKRGLIHDNEAASGIVSRRIQTFNGPELRVENMPICVRVETGQSNRG